MPRAVNIANIVTISSIALKNKNHEFVESKKD